MKNHGRQGCPFASAYIRVIRGFIFGALSLSCVDGAFADLADQVVVIANKNVPKSIDIAQYYMNARSIPTNNLFVADLPARESITREFFETRLRDPLLEFLRDRGLAEQVKNPDVPSGSHESPWRTVKCSVRYLVSTYGMPLRIVDSKPYLVARVANLIDEPNLRDSAALDSELALLLHAPYDIRGRVGNPLYDALRVEDLGTASYSVLIATRLDGPDPAGVKRMIDRGLRAEKYGLQGRAYFDALNPQTNSYTLGDYWITEAYDRFRREGYECVLDRKQPVWGTAYPMEDAAIYFGWYTDHVVGPFTRDDFQFEPGAIAYHLHSASAKTIRSSTNYWVGPLLAKGASASMGAVDEPYLSYTINLHLFAERMCEGAPFGDSCYMSMSALSWQMTIVGDPLYTPFAKTLDEQIAALEKDKMQEREWAYVRKVNLLVRDGRFNLALSYCRQKLHGFDSLVLREKLADLYAMNELYSEAAEQYDYIIKHAKTAETALRVGARHILLLRLQKDTEKADDVEKALREQWKDSPFLVLLKDSVP